MASSEGNTPTDNSENQSESESFNCEGLRHCYDTDEHLDRHQEDNEWVPCDETVCPHRYSGVTTYNLPEWALYPTQWQESLEFATWFLSRGLQSEPQSLPALSSLPVDTGSQVPSHVQTPVESFSPTLPHDLSHLFEEEEEVSDLLGAPISPASSTDSFGPVLSLFEPSVSDDEEDFVEFLILAANMSEPKVDTVPTLSRASEYKVWKAKMLGYLTIIDADDALMETPPDDMKPEDH